MRHPAKYTDTLLPVLAEFLVDCWRILDPFAGTCKIRQVRSDAVCNELEWEWASIGNASNVGNALALPYRDGAFDAVETSCTYGNRMADRYDGRDGSRRNTYRCAMGHDLHPANSGAMQWGEAYREFHVAAWRECWRVLRPGGRLVLNISDHIRKGKRIEVAQWHCDALQGIGFQFIIGRSAQTPRNGFGKNGKARVEHEQVFVFEKE